MVVDTVRNAWVTCGIEAVEKLLWQRLGLAYLASCWKGFAGSARCQLVPLMHMGRSTLRPYTAAANYRVDYNLV
jgi:hypothetical protein